MFDDNYIMRWRVSVNGRAFILDISLFNHLGVCVCVQSLTGLVHRFSLVVCMSPQTANHVHVDGSCFFFISSGKKSNVAFYCIATALPLLKFGRQQGSVFLSMFSGTLQMIFILKDLYEAFLNEWWHQFYCLRGAGLLRGAFTSV